MTRFGRLLLLPLALVAASPVLAQTAAGPGSPGNVSIAIKVGRVEAGKAPTDQVFRMVLRDGADDAQMLVGWRMPIPTGKKSGDAGDAGVTEYTYQNVGLTARFRVNKAATDRYAVDGEIEVSGTSKEPNPGAGGAPPVIGTLQQRVSVMLAAGKPLRIAEGPHPEGGTAFVEIELRPLE